MWIEKNTHGLDLSAILINYAYINKQNALRINRPTASYKKNLSHSRKECTASSPHNQIYWTTSLNTTTTKICRVTLYHLHLHSLYIVRHKVICMHVKYSTKWLMVSSAWILAIWLVAPAKKEISKSFAICCGPHLHLYDHMMNWHKDVKLHH